MHLPCISVFSLTLLTFTTLANADCASFVNQDISSRDEIVLQDPGQTSIPAWQFYYGVDSAVHQEKFNNLSTQGYRMISLSSYGSPSSAEYAAVWVKRPGPLYWAIHGADGTTYQKWFDQHSAEGYVSTIITATGPPGSAIFSGVMEKISVPAWFQRCGMSVADLEANMKIAANNKQILKSFREYGTPSNRLYCAIWHYNPNFDKWTWWLSSGSGYQTVFNSETTKPYWRAAYLSISEDQNYMSLFTDTSVGPWVARHGMTGPDLQAEYENQKAAGRYIIHLTGGGSGSSTRYAALFASQDIPSSRTWRVIGNAPTGFKDNNAANSKTESILKSFMQAASVRQCQLSIAKNGVPLLDKAYTWSEPERVTTKVDGTFLLASVSKTFVEAAIQSLYDSRKLLSDTKVYSFLGYKDSSGDPRRFDITVQQLLDHRGGYNASQSGDPTYDMRNIAHSENGVNSNVPASMKNIVDYMFTKPLDFTPGTAYAYSNYGYLLLSYVVEYVTKQPYFTYLQNTFLTPDGLDVKAWLTDPALHAGDNVIQESRYTGLSARQPQWPYNVADVYGGDGMEKDSALGSCALAASAQALTKFIHKHAAWGNGGRRPGARAGSTPGASTFIESRGDGIDWAVTVNTRDFAGNGDVFGQEVVDKITEWLKTGPAL